MKNFFAFLTIFFSPCAVLLAAPPPLPSAGVVEREIEKEYEANPLERDKSIPAIRIDIPKETLQMPRGKTVTIYQVIVQGHDVMSSKKIAHSYSRYMNKEMSIQDIYDLCLAIEQEYAKEGYFLARAYPPPQTIEGGVLRIEVLEGKLGNIRIEGQKHYSEGFIKGYFADLQNKPLQYDQFLRRLMLVNENTDLQVEAIFEKGEEAGCADVILTVKDGRPIHLYLNGNNYGKDLTTNVRAGGRFDWGSMITQGDTLSLAEVVGFPVDALYFTDAKYTVPLNRKGTFLQGSYLFSRFKIEELTDLHLKGRSDIATLKIDQALTRTRNLSINIFSYFDYKQIQNYVLSDRVSFDKLRVLTVGSVIDHYKPGVARDYFNVRVATGIPDFLGGLKAVDSECSRVGGGGKFFMFNVDYDRLQHLPKNSFLYFHVSGQGSPSKLTLPEQIYIGGVDTVRGYPLAIALGDSGYYANLELRVPPFFAKKKWKEMIQFDAFLDHGGVFLNSAHNTFLWGTGVGIKVNAYNRFSFSIDVGFPLNHKDMSKGAFTYIKLTGQPF